MKIVVCVKHVGCIYHPTAVDLHSGEIDSEKMVFMLNPYDEVALEAALRIKEQVGDCDLILITAGSVESEQALRYAGAMGGPQIDRMIRVHCDRHDQLDAWQTSLMLSEAIRSMSPHVILCGKKAIDTNGCQVGAYIASHLSLSLVSGIIHMQISPEENKAVVHRYLGKGDRQEVTCDLPGLFTVDLGLNDPRYPTMKNRFFAEKMKIEVIDPDEAGLICAPEAQLTRIEQYAFPRPKTRKVFTPDSNLSVMDRMNAMLMGGGGKKEDSSILEGSEEELAGYLLEFLKQNKIFDTDGV